MRRFRDECRGLALCAAAAVLVPAGAAGCSSPSFGIVDTGDAAERVEVEAADAVWDEGDAAEDAAAADPRLEEGDAREEPPGDAPSDLAAEEEAPPPPPPELPIGFWCGPPDAFISAARYREAKEAGFTFIMPPCEGRATRERNLLILDAAREAGMTAFVADERMPQAVTGTADAAARLGAIVADYSSHPALAGYYVTDEPNAAAFPGLAEVVAYLRDRDPAHPAYINLFPNYASAAQLGTPTYEEHVARFLSTVQPEILSYDHYHFLTTGDRPGFFDNLAVVRRLALARGVPFWQIVLAIPHGPYRSLTEAEKRWEAMQTLAYGGKGVMFFTYWTPPGAEWAPSIIATDGSRTRQYDEVKRIDAAAQAVGRELVGATSTAVFQNGVPAPGGTIRPPGLPVLFPGGGDVTTGVFSSGADTLVLFASRDYRAALSVDVLLAVGAGGAWRLDKASGGWIAAGGEAQFDGTIKVRLDLAAGDGELYRLPGPLPDGPAGPEVMMGLVRADAGFMYLVDSAHGLSWIGGGGWNTCFEGYPFGGRAFHSNGFWMCVREDLAGRTFHVGNVVADHGYFYRVAGGTATQLADAGWDTCPAGSRLVGRKFESNGFWVCME